MKTSWRGVVGAGGGQPRVLLKPWFLMPQARRVPLSLGPLLPASPLSRCPSDSLTRQPLHEQTAAPVRVPWSSFPSCLVHTAACSPPNTTIYRFSVLFHNLLKRACKDPLSSERCPVSSSGESGGEWGAPAGTNHAGRVLWWKCPTPPTQGCSKMRRKWN